MPKENVTSERLAQFLATLPNRNVHIVHDLEPGTVTALELCKTFRSPSHRGARFPFRI